MKSIKRIAALLLCAWLLCALPAQAYANGTPDAGRRGTITVNMVYDGRAVPGGVLTAYRVGQIHESNGDYSFIKTAEVEDLPESFDELGAAELAEKVADYVRAHGVPAYQTAENTGGKAVFRDVETGLYLIEQTRASDGFEPLGPFLISLPMNEGGHYQYEVTAEGKFQLVGQPSPSPTPTPSPSPSARPTPPPRPTPPRRPYRPRLPQTGQLNWPVPVLTVLGLGVFSAGWGLRFGKRKDGHEK